MVTSNINSAGGTINLLDNVNVNGNMNVTGNVTVGGNITLGDETTDPIQITARIDSDIIPAVDNTYKLGTTSLAWQELNVGKVVVDDITIDNDTIFHPTGSDGSINFVPNGAGKLQLIILDLIQHYS